MSDPAPQNSTIIRRAKLAAFALALFALGFSAGCASSNMKITLPEISAQSIRYQRTDPAGGTKISATNLVDHGDKVTADKVMVSTIYPSFSISIEVDGYVRNKAPSATPAPEAAK